MHMHMHMHKTHAKWRRKRSIHSCIFSLVSNVTLISIRVASLCRANHLGSLYFTVPVGMVCEWWRVPSLNPITPWAGLGHSTSLDLSTHVNLLCKDARLCWLRHSRETQPSDVWRNVPKGERLRFGEWRGPNLTVEVLKQATRKFKSQCPELDELPTVFSYPYGSNRRSLNFLNNSRPPVLSCLFAPSLVSLIQLKASSLRLVVDLWDPK